MSQHILIIGAGVCGLAIAHGLNKAGIPFTIFEAEEDSTFQPREWTMALHWSIPMLESLLPDDLVNRWKIEAAVDKSLDYSKHPNNTIGVFDGVDGKCLREIAVEGDYLRVSRRKLRAACHEGIDVRYGHTLQKMSRHNNTITGSFTNRTQFTGTLLVGADGPRSYSDADKAGFVRSANPVTAFMVHPDVISFVAIQHVPDPELPETWGFQLIVNWKGVRDKNLTNEEKHKEVKEKAEKLAEPFRSAILWIPDDIKILYSDFGVWVPEPW